MFDRCAITFAVCLCSLGIGAKAANPQTEYHVAKPGDVGYVAEDPQLAQLVGKPAALFTATAQWAAANGAAVKGFQRALSEAIAYGNAHPAEARASMARYTKLPPAVVASLALPNMFAKITPQQIHAWAEICKEQGLIDAIPDSAKLVVPWQAEP